jgi:hypothetical protein
MLDDAEKKTIETICAAFGGEDPSSAGDIPKAQVLEWMRSGDLQVRGCIYAMIAEAERAQHIKLPLEFEDYYDFVVPYLEQCIEDNPSMEWVENRYTAGYALVQWIVSFWESEAVPREKIAAIKERLAALYKRGDVGVRDGVVNGVLEHLFEHPGLAEYFKDWQADPVLAPAYADALLWKELMPPTAP